MESDRPTPNDVEACCLKGYKCNNHKYICTYTKSVNFECCCRRMQPHSGVLQHIAEGCMLRTRAAQGAIVQSFVLLLHIYVFATATCLLPAC